MKKKTYEMRLQWQVRDTRDIHGGYRVGESNMRMTTSSKEDLINSAINFCENLPSWEFERNHIDTEEYRDGKWCRYFYLTSLLRVLEIKEVK